MDKIKEKPTKKYYKKYSNYLAGSVWAKTKRRFRESSYCKNVCFVCGARDTILDLHHKSYARIGNEELTDLIELCPACHGGVHSATKEQKIKGITLWNAADKLRLEPIPPKSKKKKKKKKKLSKEHKKFEKLSTKEQIKFLNRLSKHVTAFTPSGKHL